MPTPIRAIPFALALPAGLAPVAAGEADKAAADLFQAPKPEPGATNS